MIKISQEVISALKNKQPVVALESTIISHGMPYPQNVETALAVEKIIREHGAVPATIGIIDGVGVVGNRAHDKRKRKKNNRAQNALKDRH
jgi:pseudouridine-5'-phosphate glycosidase